MINADTLIAIEAAKGAKTANPALTSIE